MKRAFLALVMVAGLMMSCTNETRVFDANYKVSVTDVTDTSLTISADGGFVPDSMQLVWWRDGSQARDTTAFTINPETSTQTAVISPLKPDTYYVYYIIGYKGEKAVESRKYMMQTNAK